MSRLFIMRKGEHQVFVCDYDELVGTLVDDYRDMVISESPDDADDAMVWSDMTKRWLDFLPTIDCGPMTPAQVEDEME